MAVDVGQLAIGLRLSADGAGLTDAQTAILTRLLGVSEAFVELPSGAGHVPSSGVRVRHPVDVV